MLKNQKGITLVALVITIIVLLILAGVSLSLVLNPDTGLIARARQAEDAASEGSLRDNATAALANAAIEKAVNESTTELALLKLVLKDLEDVGYTTDPTSAAAAEGDIASSKAEISGTINGKTETITVNLSTFNVE